MRLNPVQILCTIIMCSFLIVGYTQKGNAAGLTWNTFLGGSNGEFVNDMVIDSDGNIYIVGGCYATWGTPLRAYAGGSQEAFVAKINNRGALLWHTFLGSTGNDWGFDIALDTSGNIYVTGRSNAAWPESPTRVYSGGIDCFAAKMDPNGSLIWHSFLGHASGNDFGNAIAADSSGNAYVTGISCLSWYSTNVSNFTTGGTDVHVTKLNGTGFISWNTFLGSSG